MVNVAPDIEWQAPASNLRDNESTAVSMLGTRVSENNSTRNENAKIEAIRDKYTVPGQVFG